ncbi:MAG: DNA-binding protein [Ferruginibacter sp.]
MPNPFFKKLEEIKKLLLSQKEILNVEELAIYTGWSKSYIYKLTMACMIPHYKPHEGAKLLYFKKSEIENYMTAYKVKTTAELDVVANDYLTKKKMKNVNR